MIVQYVEDARFNKIRIESLDALRGGLSIIVCIAHAWQVLVNPFEHGTTITYFILGVVARGAVLCFFCLSGYVIALSIELNIKRNHSFISYEFVLARFWRIAPPLLLVMVVTLIISLVLESFGANKIPDSISAARHVYDTNFSSQLGCLMSACLYGDLTGGGFNGPLWSLAFEIQLYAISGMLTWIVFSINKSFYRLLGALLLVIYFGRVLKLYHGFYLNTQVVSYACYFFGVLMYLFYRCFNKYALMVIAGGLAVGAGFFAYNEGPSANMESSSWLLFQLFIGGLFAFAIAGIARIGLLDRWSGLGVYSYMLYISHFPLIVFVYFLFYNVAPEFLSEHYLFVFLLAVVLVIFLTKKIGVFVEQPRVQRDFFRKNVIQYLSKSPRF